LGSTGLPPSTPHPKGGLTLLNLISEQVPERTVGDRESYTTKAYPVSLSSSSKARSTLQLTIDPNIISIGDSKRNGPRKHPGRPSGNPTSTLRSQDRISIPPSLAGSIDSSLSRERLEGDVLTRESPGGGSVLIFEVNRVGGPVLDIGAAMRTWLSDRGISDARPDLILTCTGWYLRG
jgi:hypothetical protein